MAQMKRSPGRKTRRCRSLTRWAIVRCSPPPVSNARFARGLEVASVAGSADGIDCTPLRVAPAENSLEPPRAVPRVTLVTLATGPKRLVGHNAAGVQDPVWIESGFEAPHDVDLRCR